VTLFSTSIFVKFLFQVFQLLFILFKHLTLLLFIRRASLYMNRSMEYISANPAQFKIRKLQCFSFQAPVLQRYPFFRFIFICTLLLLTSIRGWEKNRLNQENKNKNWKNRTVKKNRLNRLKFWKNRPIQFGFSFISLKPNRTEPKLKKQSQNQSKLEKTESKPSPTEPNRFWFFF